MEQAAASNPMAAARRSLDSFVLDAYVGLTAGWVAEFLSLSPIDHRFVLLLLPLTILSIAGFLRSGVPISWVWTFILVSTFALTAPIMLIKLNHVPLRAAIVFWHCHGVGNSAGSVGEVACNARSISPAR